MKYLAIKWPQPHLHLQEGVLDGGRCGRSSVGSLLITTWWLLKEQSTNFQTASGRFSVLAFGGFCPGPPLWTILSGQHRASSKYQLSGCLGLTAWSYSPCPVFLGKPFTGLPHSPEKTSKHIRTHSLSKYLQSSHYVLRIVSGVGDSEQAVRDPAFMPPTHVSSGRGAWE